jgi:hypothetical protein
MTQLENLIKEQQRVIQRLLERVESLTTSTGRSSDTTGTPAKKNTVSGAKPSTARDQYCKPSGKRSASSESGKRGKSVPNAGLGKQRGETRSCPNINQASGGQRKKSYAEAASGSPPPMTRPTTSQDSTGATTPNKPKGKAPAPPTAKSVPTTETTTQVDGKETAESATQSEVEKKKRSAPQFDGKSLRKTVAFATLEDSDKPIFDQDVVFSKKTKLSRSQRRVLRKSTYAQYEVDWYYFLLRKFMLVERTGKTMQAMKNELSKHIAKYDTTCMTGEECYLLMVKTITSAMEVPMAEVAMRQIMKNEDANDERRKHQKFAKDGIVGKSGFSLFSKTHTLPSSTG